METSQIVWLVVLVGFIVLEAVTAALVSIWFCAGALAALIVALFWPSAYVWQVVAFAVVSVIMLFALRPMAKRIVGTKRVATNADAAIGKMGQVVTEIQPDRIGRVKVEGREWAAKSDATLQVGAWCIVNAIEGVKLVVSPAPAKVSS